MFSVTDLLRLFVNLADGSKIHVDSGDEAPDGYVRLDRLPEQYVNVLDRLAARRGQIDAMQDELSEAYERIGELEDDLADCRDGVD